MCPTSVGCCDLFCFSVVVTDLSANAAIHISHFLSSKSEEKCIPCKTVVCFLVCVLCAI